MLIECGPAAEQYPRRSPGVLAEGVNAVDLRGTQMGPLPADTDKLERFRRHLEKI